MTVYEREIDHTCPGCGSDDVIMCYEALYRVGDADPVDGVKQGAKCRECSLRFVESGVMDKGPDPREVVL